MISDKYTKDDVQHDLNDKSQLVDDLDTIQNSNSQQNGKLFQTSLFFVSLGILSTVVCQFLMHIRSWGIPIILIGICFFFSGMVENQKFPTKKECYHSIIGGLFTGGMALVFVWLLFTFNIITGSAFSIP